MNPDHIVIAGASGFVGQHLIRSLIATFPEAVITALSRSRVHHDDPRVIWKPCDLFSESSIDSALPEKVDLAYYLVHSMTPTAALDQGSFADYDLIMADNFARACHKKEIKHLVYLGGLIPDVDTLSLHLQSRLEVESVFESYKIPYTFLRAGLIVGEDGSSFQILLKLVKRLHVMICPSWTQTLTSPVDLPTVIDALISVSRDRRHLGHTYDLAGCNPLTYLEMMKRTAKALRLKRGFIKVPVFTPTLSRLWVSLITHTSKSLVYPLIESLKYPMVARESHGFSQAYRLRNYSDLLQGLPMRVLPTSTRYRHNSVRQTVRSVQRFSSNKQSANKIAESYFLWLPKITKKLIRVHKDGEKMKLCLFGKLNLIELEKVSGDDSDDRITFLIHRGLLVQKHESARLEFRSVLHRSFVLIAIHDYIPSLPWFIYKYTQALIHLWVMRAFRKSPIFLKSSVLQTHHNNKKVEKNDQVSHEF